MRRCVSTSGRRAALRSLAAGALWPALARAQRSNHVPVVGVLITHPRISDSPVNFLQDGLKQYGYEHGRNIKIEARSALGKLERVPAIAEELVRLPADVIVVVNEIAARAVKQATNTIPIVLVGYINDPVALGWIESYRRPGGNLTGVFSMDLALAGKRLEILKEMLPRLARVAVLCDPAFSGRELEETQRAAASLGVAIDAIEVERGDDIATSIRGAKQKGADALVLTWSPLFWVHRKELPRMALTTGLPLASALTATDGALLSYGTDLRYNWERAGYFIDRILKGARAAELPVEQSSRVKLIVNLQTAQALKIKMPDAILLRADEVIR